MPDGKVTYVKKGETYFLPYGFTDLQDSTIPVKIGDRVRFESKKNSSLELNVIFFIDFIQHGSRSSNKSIFCSKYPITR